MTEVRLYGWLGKKYGKSFNMEVGSPAEAVRALSSQFKSFKKDLINYTLGYHVFVGKQNIGEEELKMTRKAEVIKFVPAVAGGKKGVLQTILGVVLVIVGVVWDAYTGGSDGGALINAGIGLIVGGVAQMLAGSPKPKNTPDDGSNPSYSFNGAVNTTAQGHCVPVGYGEMEVGSAVVSAAITVGVAVSGSQDTSVPVTGTPSGGGSSGDGATPPNDGGANSGGSGGTFDGSNYAPGGSIIFGSNGN